MFVGCAYNCGSNARPVKVSDKIKPGDQVYYRPLSILFTVVSVNDDDGLVHVENAAGEPYCIDVDWLDGGDYTWYPQGQKLDTGPMCNCDFSKVWACTCGRMQWERDQRT